MNFETIRAELETLRQKAMTYSIISIVLAVITVILFLSPQTRIIAFILIAGLIYFLVMADRAGKDYRNHAKEKLVLSVFRELFSDVYFNASQGFSEDFISNTGLVSMGNEYTSNDYLSGKADGVQFERSDLHIVQVTHSDKNTTRTTLFQGSWFVFDFFKNFHGYLQLRDKEDRLFGRNYKPMRFFDNRPKTERLKLDHSEFNEVFDCYASDAQEAFYLLTPHFMDRILQFNKNYPHDVLIAFIDNKLHLAMDTRRDAFEPSIFRTVDQKFMDEVSQDAKVILHVVEALDLSNDLFKEREQ